MKRPPMKSWISVSVAMILVGFIGVAALFFASEVKVSSFRVNVSLTNRARAQILRSGRPIELSMRLFGYANARSSGWADSMNRIILSKEEVMEYRDHGEVIFGGRSYPKWLNGMLNEDGPFIDISGGYYDRDLDKSLYDCSSVFSKLSDIPSDHRVSIRCDAAGG